CVLFPVIARNSRPPPRPTPFPYTTLFRSYRSQNSTWAQKLNKVFRAAVFLVAASFWANPAQAQSCTLVCNDEGQLSLPGTTDNRSEEHTSELQSRENLVCRLLLEKKKRHE